VIDPSTGDEISPATNAKFMFNLKAKTTG